ncbi:MAG TPA: TlpA disulfide reductase family protein [Beijerinckiaceae bacterium]
MIGAAALAAILYGTMQDGGKKTAAGGACAASAARAAAIAPYSRGEVAALAVSKRPQPAADISFEGPDGATRTLADFRGKAILVNLWATWCLPCRAEMPALDRLQAAAGGADFEVVAINIDTARLERRKTFLEEAGVKSLAFYADPKADVFQVLKRAGKAVGLPTTILIDADGCELGVMAGPAEWDSEDAKQLISAAVKR